MSGRIWNGGISPPPKERHHEKMGIISTSCFNSTFQLDGFNSMLDGSKLDLFQLDGSKLDPVSSCFNSTEVHGSKRQLDKRLDGS
jgi:hypothetical protein